MAKNVLWYSSQDILDKDENDFSSLIILNNLLFDTCLIDSEILFSLNDLKAALTKMAIFFTSNVDFSEMVVSNLGKSVHRKYIFMEYTREEDIWLQNQFQLLDEAYKSVTMRQDFVQGPKISKTGFAQTCRSKK